MPFYVGLDSGKDATAICIVDAVGERVVEGSVETSPAAIAAFLRTRKRRVRLVGLEASNASFWLHGGLLAAGLPVVPIETFHAHGVLRTRTNKTDRNDARGIAELMRIGAFRPVHAKEPDSRRLKLLIGTYSLLLSRQIDIEKRARSILLEHGLKLPTGRRATMARTARRLLADGHDPFLEDMVQGLFDLAAAIATQVAIYQAQIENAAFSDPVCRRLMTAPGVGPMVAIAYKAAIDDPRRFKHSRDVGAYLGLTKRERESGKRRRKGKLSKRGDQVARRLLYLAAQSLLREGRKPSWLQAWGRSLAARCDGKIAGVAVARTLAVVLHRMWVDETEFCWDRRPTASLGKPGPIEDSKPANESGRSQELQPVWRSGSDLRESRA